MCDEVRDPNNEAWFKLTPGNLIILNNRRVLHGLSQSLFVSLSQRCESGLLWFCAYTAFPCGLCVCVCFSVIVGLRIPLYSCLSLLSASLSPFDLLPPSRLRLRLVSVPVPVPVVASVSPSASTSGAIAAEPG